ncbi:MLO-like protein 6 [Hibiscus syriacus]|uniref:MLO-like protein 6 n=2 Tax=Hibiscus syriacus TaxID=106335 RepID=A0A6A3BRA8_HIBSY|nr:MLO-like protein 6 [Hibiscus syriacus]
MRKWKAWENETKTIEYQFYNDPERFRFARDTSFGRRHLNFWSRSTVTLWIVCFFRQFFGSVTKVDYLTLRHGFIMAHLAPGNETKFDFQKYIKRSLEDDFKVVVGISPIIWFIAVLFLLAYTHGWYSYLWLPFMPLIITLMVGAKLQVIITKMGLRIQDRGDVVKGAPVVQPGDDLFWFGRPHFLLFLIHVVLFTNAFQLAFFVWSTYEFTIKSCYHEHVEDVIIRVSMGVIIQFLCSYVTLPLYALVTQMGTNMRPTIFNDRIAAALKNWHHTAKKHTKQSRQLHSENTTPFSSRPATPTHRMSPVHFLHNYPRSTESYRMSPGHLNDQWDPESFRSPGHHHEINDLAHDKSLVEMREVDRVVQESNSSSQFPATAPRMIRTQHEIDIIPSDFSFAKE